MNDARPKSIILSSCKFCLNMIFSGLRSLCIIFYECIYATPVRIYFEILEKNKLPIIFFLFSPSSINLQNFSNRHHGANGLLSVQVLCNTYYRPQRLRPILLSIHFLE